MSDKIKKLLKLNLEIEGALRIIEIRDNEDTRELLKDKFEAFSNLVNQFFYDKDISSTDTLNNIVDNPGTEEYTNERFVQVEECFASSAVIDDSVLESEPEPDLQLEPEPEPEPEPESEPEPEPDAEPESEPEPDQSFMPQAEPESEPEPEPDPDLSDTPQVEPASPEPLEPSEVHSIADVTIPEHADEPDYSVNDSIQPEMRLEDVIVKKNSKDLFKVFTINDKFRFIRGLFCDDKNDFEYTLAQISSFDSLDMAYDYLLNELGWDIDNDEVKEFITKISNYFNAL